jgi:hypothetical protein
MVSTRMSVACQRLAIGQSAAGVARTYHITRTSRLTRLRNALQAFLPRTASRCGGLLNSVMVAAGDRLGTGPGQYGDARPRGRARHPCVTRSPALLPTDVSHSRSAFSRFAKWTRMPLAIPWHLCWPRPRSPCGSLQGLYLIQRYVATGDQHGHDHRDVSHGVSIQNSKTKR